jgi:hypothetical protein
VDFPDLFPVDLFTSLIIPLLDFWADFSESNEISLLHHNIKAYLICGGNKTMYFRGMIRIKIPLSLQE